MIFSGILRKFTEKADKISFTKPQICIDTGGYLNKAFQLLLTFNNIKIAKSQNYMNNLFKMHIAALLQISSNVSTQNTIQGLTLTPYDGRNLV